MNILKNIPWAAVAAMAVFVAMGIVAHLYADRFVGNDFNKISVKISKDLIGSQS